MKEEARSKNAIDKAIKVLMNELNVDSVLVLGSTLAPKEGSNQLPLQGVTTLSVFGDVNEKSDQWAQIPFGSQMGMMSIGRMSLEQEQLRTIAMQEAEANMQEIEITEDLINYMASIDVPDVDKMQVGDKIRLTTDAAEGLMAKLAMFKDEQS